jgi:hypothetical protein
MKKRIITTITHRIDTINILAKHLTKQRSSFDEWHIWFNSFDQELKHQLSRLNAYIFSPKNSNPLDKLDNLHKFYKEDGVDPNANYLKLDDDIVWMEPNFINKMFDYREQYSEKYFLIYPNIINNGILSNIQMRFGNIPWNDRCWYNFMDSVGWGNPIFAENLHNLFLQAIKNKSYNTWHFNKWVLDYKEQLSINAISWTGKDFQTFGSTITGNDEFWINVYGPSILNKPSVILGDMICVHYAFHPQKSHLDTTNILEEYEKLANSV